MNYSSYIALIPLLPLAGFVLLGLFGRKYLKASSGIIWAGLLLVSCALSLYTAYEYFFVDGKLLETFTGELGSGAMYSESYQTITAVKYSWLSFSESVSIDMG